MTLADRHEWGTASDGDSCPRVAAIIPALDEEPSISGVVEGLRAQPLLASGEVIVVDNGSTDGTGEVAARAGARVVREERRGYGYACLAGVLATQDAEVIVLLDADASDDPDDLQRVLDPVLADEADLVVGSRALGVRERGSMTWQQVFGNRLAAVLIRLLYGLKVTDMGPFRSIRRERLLRLEIQEMTYGWPVEMMVKSARSGYRYREAPVRYHRRIGVRKVGGTLLSSLVVGERIISTTLRYARWKPAKSEQPAFAEAER